MPREHRSDSLAAAFRNPAKPDADDLTRRSEALVTDFDIVATRNNCDVADENGSIESRHGHVKTRIAQAPSDAPLPRAAAADPPYHPKSMRR